MTRLITIAITPLRHLLPPAAAGMRAVRGKIAFHPTDALRIGRLAIRPEIRPPRKPRNFRILALPRIRQARVALDLLLYQQLVRPSRIPCKRLRVEIGFGVTPINARTQIRHLHIGKLRLHELQRRKITLLQTACIRGKVDVRRPRLGELEPHNLHLRRRQSPGRKPLVDYIIPIRRARIINLVNGLPAKSAVDQFEPRIFSRIIFHQFQKPPGLLCRVRHADGQPYYPAILLVDIAVAVERFYTFGDCQARLVVGLGARVLPVGIQSAFESLVSFVAEISQRDECVVIGIFRAVTCIL